MGDSSKDTGIEDTRTRFLKDVEEVCKDVKEGPFPVWFYFPPGDYLEASFGPGPRYARHTNNVRADNYFSMDDDTPIGFTLWSFSGMTERDVEDALKALGVEVPPEVKDGIIGTWKTVKKNG